MMQAAEGGVSASGAVEFGGGDAITCRELQPQFQDWGQDWCLVFCRGMGKPTGFAQV